MLVAGRLLVAGRWRSIGSAPPGEAAFAARTAGVRVDCVCLCVCVCVCRFVVTQGCLQLFVIGAAIDVCYWCCCVCGLWLLLCLRVVCLDIFDIAA